VFVKSVVCTPV